MTEHDYKAGRRSRTLAYVLVAVGMVLLLSQVGLLGPGVLAVISSVLLIGWGADLLTNGLMRSRIVRSGAAVLVVSVALIGAANLQERMRRASIPAIAEARIADVSQVDATITQAFGNVSVRGSNALKDLLFETDRASDGISYSVDPSTGHGMLNVESSSWRNGNFDLRLSPEVPLNLTIEVTGGNAKPIDLSDLNVQQLRLEVVGGNAEVQLPARGILNATIESSGGNIELHVPEALPARITAQADFGNVDIDERFTQQGNVYVSESYSADAADRADITVTSTAGNVEIN